MKYLIAWVVILIVPGMVSAQINHPRISPQTTLIQEIGLSEVRIVYSRPGARGRKVMGELVPFGRIWRVGANESTKIHFSDSVNIEGLWLSPGTYALYAIPYEKEWTIIFHTNLDHWGDGRTKYKPEEDALRCLVKPDSQAAFQETLTLEWTNLSHRGGELVIHWENTRVHLKMRFNTHQKVMREIRDQLQRNPTAMTYYEAARYLQEEGIDPLQAKQWLQQAHKLAGDTYYIHRVWALTEAQLKNYKEAIEHAEISKRMAAAEGKDEFVRMNVKSIDEWKMYDKLK